MKRSVMIKKGFGATFGILAVFGLMLVLVGCSQKADLAYAEVAPAGWGASSATPHLETCANALWHSVMKPMTPRRCDRHYSSALAAITACPDIALAIF